MSEVQIEALDEPEAWASTFDEHERAVLRLSDAMSNSSHSLDPVLISDLRGLFSEEELAEIVLVAGQANLNNRAGNAAKVLLGS